MRLPRKKGARLAAPLTGKRTRTGNGPVRGPGIKALAVALEQVAAALGVHKALDANVGENAGSVLGVDEARGEPSRLGRGHGHAEPR